MIEFIQGKIDELQPTLAVIETAGGVGYALNISLCTYSAIQGKSQTRLYVHEAIREDAYILYGFSEKRERDLFQMLISVPGIGGSSARMIQSAFSPNELIEIISTGNDAQLKKVKGIGPKTAQRIIVDLHDKISLGGDSDQTVSLIGGTTANKVVDEAVAALTMLGFQQAASQKTVQSIVKDHPDITVEAAIKEALKHI